ncbi:MAG: acetoacetate decarboxylase family protein [Actinobacteria bacterium]|jgi:acetoacetate decarboxylase|nr:acetoacetate decarboxylase family protein [Actinomycetota bacterium]MCL5886575.1 acetoacetate decarboxylase family protein [Actinomycetota bacterium]
MLSLPVPLYPEPPYTYDEAKVAIAFLDNPLSSVPPGLLPEGIEYLPLQVAVFADYPDSTIGPYREVVVLVGVMRNGNPALYCPLIYVTSDTALCAGREIWGFPKKLAVIDIEHGEENSLHCRLERGGDDLLVLNGSVPNEIDASSVMLLENLTVINHKLIPSVGGGNPDVDVLSTVSSEQSIKSVLGGAGTLQAGGEVALVLGSGGTAQILWSLSDLVLPYGQEIEASAV